MTPRGRAAEAGAVPVDAHEWVEFEDEEEQRTWRFDVTFLLSPWHCIYAAGCQGVLTGPAPELAQGCCSYGAHFTDDADLSRVKQAAMALSPRQWQHHGVARHGGVARRAPEGGWMTRLVEGACIFLNRPGFPTGPGCALHQAALAAGKAPMSFKPDVCWQLPLRREDVEDGDGHVTSTVGQWERRHWGAGGQEFHWWCTEAPQAFGASAPVYLTMASELSALVGQATYERLRAYLDLRRSGSAPLPHPSLRRAAGRSRRSGS